MLKVCSCGQILVFAASTINVHGEDMSQKRRIYEQI